MIFANQSMKNGSPKLWQRAAFQRPAFFSDPLIRKAYTGAEWNGPAQGLLNPVQEVTAAEKRVQNGFSTRDREAILRKGRRTKCIIATRTQVANAGQMSVQTK